MKRTMASAKYRTRIWPSLAIALGGIAAYALITAVAMTEGWKHYELLVEFIRYAVLAPAVLYGLRSGGSVVAPCVGTRVQAIVIAGFFAVAAGISWYTSPGSQPLPDADSYRFEARILSAGEMIAPPPPGATQSPAKPPKPISFTHDIVWKKGWFSMYPIGWPLALALPEKLHVGWLANPILGTLLLVIIALIGREIFDSTTALLAVLLAAFSPYFLVYSAGRLSHALSATLIALACLFCIQGLKTGRMARFIWMFVLLVPAFHVRPFTAFLASVVLGLAALIGTRTRRVLSIKVAAAGTAAAALAVVSLLFYNRAFTGSALLSPYALQRGVSVPVEIRATAPQIAHNLALIWRFSAEQTLFYVFPFVIPLAIYSVWARRPQALERSILLILPIALIIGYLVQVEPSGSVFGERYWFEGYFGVVILAADGLVLLLKRRRSNERGALMLVAAIGAAQLVVTAATIVKLGAATLPAREMHRLAESYKRCNCVVYLQDTPPYFYATHLNLNGPDWPSAQAFYAVDPGETERGKWASILARPNWGKAKWKVLRYDAERGVAVVSGQS